MAVRDENFNWKKESIEFLAKTKEKLTPILDEMLKEGFTVEDFVYIATFGLSEMGIDYALKKKWR